MSSNTGKGLHQSTATVNIGCSCRRLKLSTIFCPTRKTDATTFQNNPNLHGSSSSSCGVRGGDDGGLNIENDDGKFPPNKIATSPHYFEAKLYPEISETVKGSARMGDWESVAVVKDSNDPYLDFRESMIQMILEKKIYSRDDLQELLHCFLKLNSPDHHDIIIRAFMEIWNGASG